MKNLHAFFLQENIPLRKWRRWRWMKRPQWDHEREFHCQIYRRSENVRKEGIVGKRRSWLNVLSEMKKEKPALNVLYVLRLENVLHVLRGSILACRGERKETSDALAIDSLLLLDWKLFPLFMVKSRTLSMSASSRNCQFSLNVSLMTGVHSNRILFCFTTLVKKKTPVSRSFLSLCYK